MMKLKESLMNLAQNAKHASYEVMTLSTNKKNAVLAELARLLQEQTTWLLEENAKDLSAARHQGLKDALIDRLQLTENRLKAMSEAVLEIMRQKDPVGEVTWGTVRPNGLEIEKVRVPIGVICIIYESRPNVTTDAFSLAFKAGNSVILRGGSESIHSNRALGTLIQRALESQGVPASACSVVQTTEREALAELLRMSEHIDLVIPRGGEGLIRMVTEQSRIPVIKHYKGVCHVFVDKSASLEMAQRIVVNAKVQRPGVCNAAETLLIHKDFPSVKSLLEALLAHGVQIRTDGSLDAKQMGFNMEFDIAQPDDWSNEYLDLRMNAKLVPSLDDAIQHINSFGSHHSDSIVTSDYKSGQVFLKKVDSAAVYVNASTRFTDGAEFGFGAEIGISTDKLHSRGPMGAVDLTTYKYIVRGDGQIRT
jgi:glutamate-5-semialdehyde dehydrogenase